MSEPDCQTCGACCSFFCKDDLSDIGKRGYGIFIGDDDVSKLPKQLVVLDQRSLPISGESWTDGWLRGRFTDADGWRCKALDGQIGKSVACTVYEHRPTTCREFEPGSEKCVEARRMKGVR